jgi:hypothetical protein
VWTVCAEDGRTGWFPSNYVEDIPLEQQASQAQADKEIPGTGFLHGIVIFDYSILCFINCTVVYCTDFIFDLTELVSNFLHSFVAID